MSRPSPKKSKEYENSLMGVHRQNPRESFQKQNLAGDILMSHM